MTHEPVGPIACGFRTLFRTALLGKELRSDARSQVEAAFATLAERRDPVFTHKLARCAADAAHAINVMADATPSPSEGPS